MLTTLLYFFYHASVSLLLTFFVKLLWSKRRAIGIFTSTIERDLKFGYVVCCKNFVDWIWKFLNNESVFKSLDKRCKTEKDRGRACFLYGNEKWTFGQVQTMSFQVANYFQTLGYKKGDVVGLVMQNRPEVVCLWLGLSRLGVITALINYNIKGASLKHCILASKCKSVIFGAEVKEAMKEIWQSLQQKEEPQMNDILLYELDRYFDDLRNTAPSSSTAIKRPSFSIGEFSTIDLASCLRTTSTKATVLRSADEVPRFFDTFLYIFTSGTTGLPKPVKCLHSRQHIFGTAVYFLGLDRDRDITYCPLPLYHSFALSGVMWALCHGVPVVIVPKFSASRFWNDIHYYKATTCIYMGEICRFILNQPESNLEKNHTLRVMYGLGAKAEVWKEFVDRFKIKRFVETYGSTEGNCFFVNMEGTKVGAVGYIPVIAQPYYSVKVIKINEITGEIIRDKETGLAIACKPNEPGELVGKIVNFLPTLRYDGYTSDEANKKKILQNVFRKGDSYFRSGDIMSMDEEGYFFFKDRIGDTFRFKGENVSTAEVEGMIERLIDMKTTVVYGVKIPGTEGRAGMATIVDSDGTLDLEKLAEGVEKGLPSYSRPIFIRVTKDGGVSMTGTFKLSKVDLQSESFNIEQITDPIYMYSTTYRRYQKLEMETYKQIMLGNYRF